MRPAMRFIPVKSADIQGAALVFRVRELLIRQRTQAINALRGYLGEFGQIVPHGAANASKLIAIVEDPESDVPEEAVPAPKVLISALAQLEAEIKTLDTVITRRANQNAGPEPSFCQEAIHTGFEPRWRAAQGASGHGPGDYVRAVEFTPSRDGDGPVLPDLLSQIPEDEPIGTVTADGAYNTRRCHTAVIDRHAAPIIPIRRNGRLWKEDRPAARARSDTLRATPYYGRAFWKRWTGYHARSRIEARMGCLKLFGERIMARDPDRQTAEIHIRLDLMDRFNPLGTAEIVRVA